MSECPACGAGVEEWENVCTACGADFRQDHGAGGGSREERSAAGSRPDSSGGALPADTPRESHGGRGGGHQHRTGSQSGERAAPGQSGTPGAEESGGAGGRRGWGALSRRGLLVGGAGLAVGTYLAFFREGDDGESDGTDRVAGSTTAESPGKQLEGAPEISSGTHGPYTVTDGEDHFFAVQVSEGDELEVTANFDHDEGDLDLDLFDPSGSRVDRSSSVTDDESISVTASQSGTYTIDVYGWSDASNEYTLEVTIRSLADNEGHLGLRHRL